ncbi:sugar ABC transporter ATP-binding protein [Rhizobium sp. R72]|uniref:sugar ABC transporter ATP-binding protein n=1 Tax=unclassified Rhizobium TaxID=2613769 RepID=UPI000B52D593|nr:MULTISPECIES: sugar ABC transporter ATP-binding protein [unclassified Rhizobium]OWW04786.1 sugar ABC transporter ATP-binding protein [Rhizobium sp. R72]OWW05843.1 sugar ABC transporter ATP-binding protein [Rhizobium sp. R711]
MILSEPLLRIEGMAKRYDGVIALKEANIAIRPGAIHAVLGENGAGKSTLIKIMAGVIAPDEGRMFLDGKDVSFSSPAAATAAGVVSVFQELSLIPDLSVADNIVISNPPQRFGMIDRRAQRRIAEEALARAGASDIHPSSLVKDLPLSRRQMVEIAKGLARRPRLMILDEATSALTKSDVEKIFGVLKRLRSEGLALVYISHRMHEIAELADDCTVFRNGRSIESYPAGTKTDTQVVELMIGREYKSVFPAKPGLDEAMAPILSCRGLSWSDRLTDIAFDARAGEIVGVGGLDGQGQRELLLALFGVLRDVKGDVRINGRSVHLTSPKRAKSGSTSIALIPEDRKTEGLMLPMTVRENLSIAALGSVSRNGIIDRRAETARIGELLKLLSIKAASVDMPVASLSGGNQQKVVIAKWLMNRPQIILLNDPTRGIDVGTKQEIYQLLRNLADCGAAIIFYSTDYDELIGCCDRVLVMYDGTVVRTLEGDDINERELIGSALNIAAQPNGRRIAQ